MPTAEQAQDRPWSSCMEDHATAGSGRGSLRDCPTSSQLWPGACPAAASHPIRQRASARATTPTASPPSSRRSGSGNRTYSACPSEAGSLELYRWHPAVPRTLCLASAYAGWAGSLPPEVAEQRKQGMFRRIELPPDQWASEWIPTLLTDSAPTEVVEHLRAILSDFHPDGQRALLTSGFAEHDLRDVLPGIKVPTLLLYGERDVRSPLDVAQAMHTSIPGSTLVVIPGAGHMIDMEAPEHFNTEVRAFLKSI